MEKGDPETMDGRTIAARLAYHVKDPARDWDYVSFWAGVAIARLLEYQRRLEAAGLLERREAGGGGPSPPPV